jgi:hypothetical protein
MFDSHNSGIPYSVVKYMLDHGLAQKEKPSEILRPVA